MQYRLCVWTQIHKQNNNNKNIIYCSNLIWHLSKTTCSSIIHSCHTYPTYCNRVRLSIVLDSCGIRQYRRNHMIQNGYGDDKRAAASKAKCVWFDWHSIVADRRGQALSGLMKWILKLLNSLIIVLLSYGGTECTEMTGRGIYYSISFVLNQTLLKIRKQQCSKGLHFAVSM